MGRDKCMDIGQVLSLDTIELDLKGSNKEEVLLEMVGILYDGGKISDKDKFYSMVLAREEERSTGMGRGVAIPHGKCSQVGQLALVLGISKEGIDFDSLDKKDVNIFFMVADFEGPSTNYLNLLAELARNIRQSSFREGLLRAKTKEEALELIKLSSCR